MRTLICGSFAYDTIMVFTDRFRNHILPDQVHILNVCFVVPDMRREFGGCAGNIAFNLKLLDGDPLPMGTVGDDFEPYAGWLERCAIEQRHLRCIENSYTAQAYITTDMDDNQITAFHPGAMAEAHLNKVGDARDVELGIVCPDGREAMIQHAEQFAELGIPFFFDPGQNLPLFDSAELNRFIELADYVVVNDYESQLLRERTARPLDDIAANVAALIVTRGAQGSVICVDGQQIEIPAIPVSQPLDPTGCGDAYRGGLLYGIGRGMDWETTGRLASLMGALAVEAHGTQNHRADSEQIAARFEEHFGYRY